MNITTDQVQQFTALYEQAQGQKLDKGAARILLRRLLHLYRVLIRKLPESD